MASVLLDNLPDFDSDEDEDIIANFHSFTDAGNHNGDEEDVHGSYCDPFDIDDGEEVPSSKTYQTIDQCMKTEIDGIIRSLSKDERIQRILGLQTKSRGSFAMKTRCRPQGVFKKQSEIASELLLKIQERSNLQDFDFFDYYIFVPIFKNLGKQTIDRLKDFIEEKQDNFPSFLQDIQQDISDSRVEDHVIRNIKTKRSNKTFRKNEETKMSDLKKRVLTEEKTLFFIVHDEAHFAPLQDNLVDGFINDPAIIQAPNVILLQVSATPYCLVTKNSRIPEENVLNWFSNNDASAYFGIKDFVQNTLESGPVASDQLKEGTMRVDLTFETNIEEKSNFEKYLKVLYKKCNNGQTVRLKKSEKCDLLRAARLHGLIMQYMKGLLKKANIPSDIYEQHFKSRSEELSQVTENMLKDIDKSKDGEGKMILLRVMEIEDGKFFASVLRRMRTLLNLNDTFSVVLDIDSEEDRKSGMDNFLNEETQFLERIQCWNDSGNPRYRPSSYKDLDRLPVILIVCERGKMGITYPPNLRWYDLRLRYSSISGVTRGALEQDFGRGCRYQSSEELPTILVSRVAYRRLFPRNSVRAKKTDFSISSSSQRYYETTEMNDSNGVYKLDPDYPKFMKKGGTKKQFPSNDLDLTPYKSWIAGKDHCDYGNMEMCHNRYLLVGRPQIGKTGAFMHLAYLIWNAMKRPDRTCPREVEHTELIDWYEDIDELHDEKAPRIEYCGQYPLVSHIKSLKLQKPSVSPRYGDPNNKNVQKWYLEDGKTYPFPDYLKESSLLKRMEPNERFLQQKKSNALIKEDLVTGSSVRLNRVYSEFCARSLTKNEDICVDSGLIKQNYFSCEIKGMGVLLRNKKSFKGKWQSSKTLDLDPRLSLTPILIPSSGRSSTALLDLTDTMEGSKYAQILLIQKEEEFNYMHYCIFHKEIDILLLNDSEHSTIGTSRYHAKKFGEMITAALTSKFIFIQDDNILHWTGVTLINDPSPLFNKEPNCRYSQQTDISLFSLLSHMKANDYLHVKDFSIIGFSLTKRTIKSRINAYGRSHVFGAVLLNLAKLTSVDYNKIAWAMEDIDFNWKTDDLSSPNTDDGLIVKCLRYVGSKKKIKGGGVVPEDIPDDLFQMLQSSSAWNVAEDKKDNPNGEKEKRKHTEDVQNMENGIPQNEQKSDQRDRELYLKAQTEVAKLKRQVEELLRDKRQLEETNEKLKRENYLRQNSDSNVSNGSESASVSEASKKRQPIQRKKRSTGTEEQNKEKLDQAVNGNLLPDGLSKIAENSYQCEKDDCEECRYIRKPFAHFKDFKSRCKCHMCSLFKSSESFQMFEELAMLDDRKSKPKRKRK